MSAGLDASTVTPGRTAPLGSLTTPARTPVCARAAVGNSARNASATRATAWEILLVMDLSSAPSRSDRSSRASLGDARSIHWPSQPKRSMPRAFCALSSQHSKDRWSDPNPEDMRSGRFAFRTMAALLLVAAVAPAQTARQAAMPGANGVPATVNLPYVEAKPVFETLREELLPAEFRARAPADIEAIWPAWVSRHDTEIRARLDRGDEDSIINLLLFGVTFTTRPRVGERDVPPPRQSGQFLDGPLIQGRLADLVAGITSAGANERLVFARRVAERHGFDLATVAGRNQLRHYLDEGLRRVWAENEAYAGTKADEQLHSDPSARTVEEGTFFRDRGLSSDTSIFPNFAVEQALTALQANGTLRGGAIRRVAIVGPGLDFTDKRDGYDFYPQQTLQPFAVIDSLIRIGVAEPGDLRVMTFDLSPRVNQHVQAARERAANNEPYLLTVS